MKHLVMHLLRENGVANRLGLYNFDVIPGSWIGPLAL